MLECMRMCELDAGVGNGSLSVSVSCAVAGTG